MIVGPPQTILGTCKQMTIPRRVGVYAASPSGDGDLERGLGLLINIRDSRRLKRSPSKAPTIPSFTSLQMIQSSSVGNDGATVLDVIE